MPHDFHEFASIVPLMEGQEFEELVADINRHGQREVIVLLDNKILDGRNRYRACQKLGLKPRFRDFNCLDGEPLDFVWSQNMARRHLDASQRAIAMAKRVKFLEHGDIKSQVSGKNNTIRLSAYRAPVSEDKAAEMAKVSPRTMARAKAVLRNGTPAEIEAVERGKARLFAVSDAVIARKKANGKEPIDLSDEKRGPRIAIPDGHTAESYTREGLKLEDAGAEISSVFKQLKIADDSYKRMREIVLIADRKDLNAQDRKAADEALRLLNEHRQLGCYSLVEHIAKRIWGEGRKKSKDVAEGRFEDFKKKIDIILHVCSAAVEIPQLDKETIEFSLESLEDSIIGINRIIKEIKETYNVG